MSKEETIAHDMALEFVKKYPNLFDKDKWFWKQEIIILLREYRMTLEKSNSHASELYDALLAVKGVMPFHDGDFTEAESQAMIKVDNAIKKSVCKI